MKINKDEVEVRINGEVVPDAADIVSGEIAYPLSMPLVSDVVVVTFDDGREEILPSSCVTLSVIKQKSKRVSVSYEKVEFSKLSKAFEEHEESPLYFKDGDGSYIKCSDPDVYLSVRKTISAKHLYRKIETEITSMQAAKDAFENVVSNHVVNQDSDYNEIANCKEVCQLLFGELMIESMRAAVNAYDKA